MTDLPDNHDLTARAFDEVAEAIGLGMPFRLLVSPDGRSRRFLHVGASCEALNGVPVAEALQDARKLYDLMPPEHRRAFAAAEAAALGCQAPFRIEVQMRRPDGETRWFRIASHPRRLADGSTVWDGLQTDITETRRLAEEVADQRRRLQMAVEATGLGLWEWDPRAAQVIWSERNKALFGLPADAHVDINRYMALIHPDDVAKVQEVYRAAEGGGDFRVEHRTNRPDGEARWILTHGRVLKEEDGAQVVVGTSVDITERKQAEDRRSLLLGELAHRAKNGLTVMMSIVGQTARASETVADFEAVLMARLEAMARSQDLVTETRGAPVSLGAVMRQVLTPFGLARFEIAPALDGVTVAGQMAASLGLLLHEMATNAVKYGALSGRRGRVRITEAAAPAGRVVVHWCETGGPPVTPRVRAGFGSRVLQVSLAPHGGKVTAAYRPAGFEARVEFPTAG
ncbi:sensor histidine kinase [Phenylobacterium sp. J367]|uniref:sensor histidine kinase n=1 Tax=Phenylobacterium sp. J367 TaxID=2898435 RepID=UPI0021513A75|nr:PAS domain-containing protein [Phenylobacterium sp. J367]MCR5878566.1 PAS domain-containing protein [Phenylobacterium sp. J367]